MSNLSVHLASADRRNGAFSSSPSWVNVLTLQPALYYVRQPGQLSKLWLGWPIVVGECLGRSLFLQRLVATQSVREVSAFTQGIKGKHLSRLGYATLGVPRAQLGIWIQSSNQKALLITTG